MVQSPMGVCGCQPVQSGITTHPIVTMMFRHAYEPP